MKLYNTLTRQIEDVVPLKAGEVTLYTCGPTVYNYYHIGNLRNAVFNDTLRRALTLAGYEVNHVMNVTDVGHLVADEDETTLSQDKLEKGAAREGKTVWEVADHYTEAFKRDMAAMNVLPPSVNAGRSKNTPSDPYARATDFIDDQIAIVQTLLERGFAYQTPQAIYFDVTKLPSYGELTGQKLSQKEVAARTDVVTDPDKHSPHDFALWFFTVSHFADHAMHWPSPWGQGFPGWHLECSAIIHALLGDPIDIHTGGIDHIGTHHPNEMAQTEAAFGHKLANYWIHNEFILVDGAKMSKSKNNAYTLKDITDRGFHPLALRLLYLQAHYRSEINFTWESLEAAQNRLLNLYKMSTAKYNLVRPQEGDRDTSEDLEDYFNELIPRIDKVLQDDLNTPEALFILSDFYANAIQPNHLYKKEHIDKLDEILVQLDKRLSLGFSGHPDITHAQKRLIADREAARHAKDWAAADKIRNELRDQHHLELDDTPEGPRWHRTTIN